MDVSLAKGKSHFSSVADAVKHRQPFIASLKGLSLQRSDWIFYQSTLFILHKGKGNTMVLLLLNCLIYFDILKKKDFYC